MKHLLLYENFEDDLSDLTRDMFGLTRSFDITYQHPVYAGENEERVCYTVKGPEENYHLALPLLQKLQDEVHKMEDSSEEYISELEISDLIWNLEIEKPLNDLGYYFYDGNKKLPVGPYPK